MLVERYLRKRYEAGKAVGFKEGAERGKTEGKAEAWQVWQAWNHRRLTAEKADHPFNEPPPSLNNPS